MFTLYDTCLILSFFKAINNIYLIILKWLKFFPVCKERKQTIAHKFMHKLQTQDEKNNISFSYLYCHNKSGRLLF